MGLFQQNREIDSEVVKTLARVEGLVPVVVVVAEDEFFSDAWRKLLADGGPTIKFVQHVDDGDLVTEVCSHQEFAVVSVTLCRREKGEAPLAELRYRREGDRSRPEWVSKESSATVDYVREWVRPRAVAQLEAQESRNLAASRGYSAEMDALRKKHL